MNKKILLLVPLLLLLTGCTVYYDIDINSDFSINEAVQFLEKREYLSQYGTDATTVMQNIAQNYVSDPNISSMLVLNVNSIKDYSSDDEWTGLKLKRNYKSFASFQSSTLFSKFFTTGELSREDDHYVFFASGFNMDYVDELTTQRDYKFDFDGLVLQITLPFKVIDSNADYIDEDKNLYSWELNKDNYMYQTIKLEFTDEKVKNADGNKNFLDNFISSTIESVSGGKIDGDSWLKKNKVNLYFSIILVTTVVCVIIIRRKIKKANQV